jgi:hypothetical protein
MRESSRTISGLMRENAAQIRKGTTTTTTSIDMRARCQFETVVPNHVECLPYTPALL